MRLLALWYWAFGPHVALKLPSPLCCGAGVLICTVATHSYELPCLALVCALFWTISSCTGLYQVNIPPTKWGFASRVLVCAFFTITGPCVGVNAELKAWGSGSDLQISISTYSCNSFLPLVLMFPSLFSICTDAGGDSMGVVCFCHWA